MSDLETLRREAMMRLMPAIYRQRDAERRSSDDPEALGPLEALLGVLSTEAGHVEDDIQGLLDDWFIETCDEWVVPYIGDLLGVRGLQEIDAPGFSRRALVANTLSYRRGKGVARVLEQLAQDATGWRAVAREEFLNLSGTQNVNHIRPLARNTPDLRMSAALTDPEGPFEQAAHLIDVRSVALGRGRFNIPNISIFLWRLQAYRLPRAELAPATGVTDGYHIHPTGEDAPLFNPPRSDAGTADRSDRRSVPGPLERRALFDELDARRAAMANGAPLPRWWFDERDTASAPPVFSLELDGVLVPPEQIAICDLSGWRDPPVSRDYTAPQPDGSEAIVTLPVVAGVDPELGRLRLSAPQAGQAVRLTHSTGAPGDLGAGPFRRRAHMEALLSERPVTFAIGVSRSPQTPANGIVADMQSAVTQWNAQPPGSVGVICVMDNGRYEEDLTAAQRIVIPEGSRLIIAAADWPAVQDPNAPEGVLIRTPGQIETGDMRPCLIGDVEIAGTAPAASETPGELFIDGLLTQGRMDIADGHLGRLALSHCTLAPTQSRLELAVGNPDLELSLSRTICGPVSLGTPIKALTIADCILDSQAQGSVVLGAKLSPLEICNTTVFGGTRSQTLSASGVIFAGPVRATRLQSGCVRYCWLEPGSVTPQPYRCQPQMALEGVSAADAPAVLARLRPAFTSQRFGDPAYGQLAQSASPAITRGNEAGQEMGAWHFLRQPSRLANLTSLMPDYLPFGQEAGLFLET